MLCALRFCSAVRPWAAREKLDTSYHAKPASRSMRSASVYLSAWSSGSGSGTSPRRIWAASLVPSSMMSEYADTWSGSMASAASTETSQSRKLSPGVPWIRSTLVPSPRSLAQPTARGTFAGVCVRSSTASTCGTADCIPKDTRVTPAAARTSKVSCVTESGFASTVTSASGASPKLSRAWCSMAASSRAGSSVGVPPPKNTLCSGRGGAPAASSTERAKRTSAAASAW